MARNLHGTNAQYVFIALFVANKYMVPLLSQFLYQYPLVIASYIY